MKFSSSQKLREIFETNSRSSTTNEVVNYGCNSARYPEIWIRGLPSYYHQNAINDSLKSGEFLKVKP